MENIKLIVEEVSKCKFVKEGYEPNGHDCWGNNDFSSYKYVIINNKEVRTWDGWFIIHNNKEVLECTIKECVDSRLKSLKEEYYNSKQLKLNMEEITNEMY